jgi:hypothetical protein
LVKNIRRPQTASQSTGKEGRNPPKPHSSPKRPEKKKPDPASESIGFVFVFMEFSRNFSKKNRISNGRFFLDATQTPPSRVPTNAYAVCESEAKIGLDVCVGASEVNGIPMPPSHVNDASKPHTLGWARPVALFAAGRPSPLIN